MENKDNIYDISVVIGRFQPLHLGHISLVNKACKISNKVIIINGCSGFKDLKNPFDKKDILNILKKEFSNDNVSIIQVYDSISDEVWKNRIYNEIKVLSNGYKNICLVGGIKDIESYSKFFNKWDLLLSDEFNSVNATILRKEYFIKGITEKIKYSTSNIMYKYLEDFKNNKEYDIMKESYTNFYLN